MTPNLPPALMYAIAQLGSGHVVLVVGAGCSSEPPTDLPQSKECALKAHQELIDDGVLHLGECTDPTDLSSVADAVKSKTGHQSDLVKRLPMPRFRLAEPNHGHILAAAMLRERALSCVMTINFDLALTTALQRLDPQGQDVSIIARPADCANLGISNLIYLHLNVDADPDDLVLSSEALERGWKKGWQEVVATRVISAPVTVFAGLGTAAAVLVQSVLRLKQALPTTVAVFQVDPANPKDSLFFQTLGLPLQSYIQLGWTEFMVALAARLVKEQCREVEQHCRELIATEVWNDEDPHNLCERLAELGLIDLGRIRARWMLDTTSYAPRSRHPVPWIADLLLAIGFAAHITNTNPSFKDDGVVDFHQGDRIIASVVIAHGRGFRRWHALQTEINSSARYWKSHAPQPRIAIIAGTVQSPSDSAPPARIVDKASPHSIVNPKTELQFLTVDELRSGPDSIVRMMSSCPT